MAHLLRLILVGLLELFSGTIAHFLGAIASNIGHATAVEAEFSACMLAIEKAMELQIQAINPSGSHLPRHSNVLVVSNYVADSLAKNGQGLAMFSTQWWPSPPTFLIFMLDRDRLGLSFSRLQ
ncbi:transmembrane protein, putative [Medicago truncatula]|uniref:Transmembrane protein, putative n=1 Tax=Medicago truncatula TaxID=3880 RepID=G7JDY1_MEDTR|nr:transmembrane protein, putative [Medicago truncatula]